MGHRKWSPFREVEFEVEDTIDVEPPPPMHRHGCYRWRCWCPELDRLSSITDKHQLSPRTLEFAIQTLCLRFPCTEREGIHRTLGWIRHNACGHCECLDRRCCVSVAKMNIALEAFFEQHRNIPNTPPIPHWQQSESPKSVASPSSSATLCSDYNVISCYGTKDYRSTPDPEPPIPQRPGARPVENPQVKTLKEERRNTIDSYYFAMVQFLSK